MGPGWSLSFGSHVIWDTLEGTATVIHDDGRQHVYTWYGATWNPPVGVYDVLTGGFSGASNYVLTFKDQSFYRYNAIDGRLMTIGDGLGNEITVARAGSPFRLGWIADAAGRQVQFGTHPATARLDSIIDEALGLGPLEVLPEKRTVDSRKCVGQRVSEIVGEVYIEVGEFLIRRNGILIRFVSC